MIMVANLTKRIIDHICKCGSRKCIGYIISSDDWKKYKKFISNKKRNVNQ